MGRLLVYLGALLLIACGNGADSAAPMVVVDTLSNGAVRTMSSAPTEPG